LNGHKKPFPKIWLEFKGMAQGTSTAFGGLQGMDECNLMAHTRPPARFFKSNITSLQSESRTACHALSCTTNVFASLSFHQPEFLILRLAPPGPLWWHINTFLLLLVALLFRLVHCRRLMLGRAVHGVQNEWCWPGVDELMLCAGWYNDEVAGLDILVFARDGCFPLAGCEGKDLVHSVFLFDLRVN